MSLRVYRQLQRATQSEALESARSYLYATIRIAHKANQKLDPASSAASVKRLQAASTLELLQAASSNATLARLVCNVASVEVEHNCRPWGTTKPSTARLDKASQYADTLWLGIIQQAESEKNVVLSSEGCHTST